MYRRITWIALLATLPALMLASCDDGTGGTGIPGMCGLDFETRFNSEFGDERIDNMLEAAASFNVAAIEMDTKVRAACNAISTDLGGATAEDTEMACDNASTAIQAVVAANTSATLTIEFVPSVCSVNASAVADCTAMCDVDFDVMATPITCEGGMLSGGCSGMCTGSCTVEGNVECTGGCSGSCSGMCTATVEGSCTGTCNGQCEGTCATMDGDGNCMGECTGTCRGMCEGTVEGTCSGQCMGMCNGSCRAVAEASCMGSCTGMCDVEFTAPSCQGGEVNVDADADCSASCEAKASFEAECTEPEIVVTFTGMADAPERIADLITTLRANLPTLLSAIDRGTVMVSAAVELAGQLTDAIDAAASTSLTAADCVREAITLQVAAASQVQVSVQVSVEVSATAGASSP